MRCAWLLALPLLAIAVPAVHARPLFGVGPLCRDSKGLAKPCPPGTRTSVRRLASAAAPVAATTATAGVPDGGTLRSSTAEVPVANRKRSLFGMGRLCRDSKGLAKPCP